MSSFKIWRQIPLYLLLKREEKYMSLSLRIELLIVFGCAHAWAHTHGVFVSGDLFQFM